MSEGRMEGWKKEKEEKEGRKGRIEGMMEGREE